MTVEKDRYESAASARKVDFIIKLVLFTILIIASIIVAIIMRENLTAVIAGVVACIWFIFSLYRVIKSARPKDLFSKEYYGKVVKIHTEPVGKDRKDNHAELYIAKDTGGVEVILGISNECACTYKKGDRVLHIKGTVCPLILERDTDIIPCPICAMPHTNRSGAKCPYCNS